ncbi:MAG TPA: hypothetical protein VMT70_17585 [Vicinamibacteria bacterium]|nr:hypothetical protein [Vicinamibacteria bacterium]
MKPALGSVVRTAVAGMLLCALSGCSDNSPRPPVVVVTPLPVRGIIAQTSFSGFQSGVWVGINVVVSQRGKLDITVDWTTTDTWMYVYFGAQQCDYTQLAKKTCAFILSSETKDPKPRILNTDFLDAGNYYLYLYNVPRDPRTGIGSDATESVSIQIGLTVFPSATAGPVGLGRPAIISPPRL